MGDTGIRTGKAPKSEWGPDDEHGATNRITPESRASIMARIDGHRVYDLSVDYFVGMPSFQAAGDPAYQIWMSHTPRGTVVDNLNGVGDQINRACGYSGDVILMYTHTGTHIDALNHFAYGRETYNGFDADAHLGSRSWERAGSEQILPLIARGILIDIAAHKGVEVLAPSYGITAEDLEECLAAQGTVIRPGDIVLVRTGRMQYWPDGSRVFGDSPGLTVEAAAWITDHKVVAVGADNEAVERTPSFDDENWLPGHCHFLIDHGVPQMECVFLEDLSRDKVYEFAFIGAPIRLRGATGSPIRPLAFPLAE
ncbi:cyclase family protein [Ruicaihuangia caeni]|uniref:Cyclase family protein n=1 Tax=Ruicaihuangia caeni TaxID=3042517 RepID=A0AAW6T9A5_9MICO|nr:cyclase family protein [Klugiella sp. YN-L-19]MDI2099371.1 cyclase family protein [Klugiella sp. YN-L-19]